MNQEVNKRDYAIDLLKVLCTLWIVGFWHLSNYGDVIDPYACAPLTQFTPVAMGIFMFFSGYFLSKYNINTTSDVMSFYKKRIKRFYGLYLLSVLCLYIGSAFTPKPWFKSDFQLINTILGTSTFFKPNVGTLWFMSMLMLFYWLTPLVKIVKRPLLQILTVVILYVLSILLNLWTGEVDERLFYLMPAYFGGLFVDHNKFKALSNNNKCYLCIVIFVVIASLPASEDCFINTARVVVGTILMVLGGGKLCRDVMKLIQKNQNAIKVLEVLSYTSLAVYLFHREVYQALTMIMGKLHIDITVLILYTVFLPSALLISFFIQKCYDIFLDKVVDRKKSA